MGLPSRPNIHGQYKVAYGFGKIRPKRRVMILDDVDYRGAPLAPEVIGEEAVVVECYLQMPECPSSNDPKRYEICKMCVDDDLKNKVVQLRVPGYDEGYVIVALDAVMLVEKEP